MTEAEKQQLNEAAAREVMRWDRKVICEVACWEREGSHQEWDDDWNPAESWADCGRLMERMKVDKWHAVLRDESGKPRAYFWHAEYPSAAADGATLPEAICRAALEAVRSMKPPRTQEANAAANQGEER